MLGAAGSFELDRAETELGTPRHALVVAQARVESRIYQAVVEEVPGADSAQSGDTNARVRADMVFFETPAGGAVFSVGAIGWGGALPCNGYENAAARITKNVLARFLSLEPFRMPEETQGAGDGPDGVGCDAHADETDERSEYGAGCR